MMIVRIYGCFFFLCQNATSVKTSCGDVICVNFLQILSSELIISRHLSDIISLMKTDDFKGLPQTCNLRAQQSGSNFLATHVAYSDESTVWVSRPYYQ